MLVREGRGGGEKRRRVREEGEGKERSEGGRGRGRRGVKEGGCLRRGGESEGVRCVTIVSRK